MLGSLDLADLMERLRGAGLRSDTRQYLAANELLLAYASRGRDLWGDPESLASHLGPIFCCSSEDQRLFRAELLAWYDTKPAIPVSPEPPRRPRTWSRWIEAAAACLTLALALIPLLYWYFGGHTVPGYVVADAVGSNRASLMNVRLTYDGLPIPVDAGGHFTLTAYRAQKDKELRAELDSYLPAVRLVNFRTEPPIRIELHAALPRTPPFVDSPISIGNPTMIAQGDVAAGPAVLPAVRWPRIGATSGSAALLVFAVLWFIRRSRRMLALERLNMPDVPQLLTLRPAIPASIDIPQQLLRRIATGLRRARPDSITELSVAATVDATVRAGGFLSTVFVPRVATPEYLFLIDRRGVEDHCAHCVYRWIEQLGDSGLAEDCYFFSGDPRVCVSEGDSSRRYHLAELLVRYHRAAVILCAETDICFDSMTGRPRAWLESLQALSRCALLTLDPPYRWSGQERLLVTAGIIVLPASPAGLQLASAISHDWRQPTVIATKYERKFPGLIRAEENRWLDRNAPPHEVVAELLQQLHAYLGSSGYTWLCACAVYPQISWAITLSLMEAVLPAGDESARQVAVEEQLPSISRLPWFRYGYMPDWLRRLLIASLPADKETAVRSCLERLLYDLLRSPAEAIAGKEPALDVRLRLAPLDIAAAAPAGSPLNDAVFLRFLGHANVDPLAMSAAGLPQAVRVRRRGLLGSVRGHWSTFALHWPNAIRSIAALAAGAVMFAALTVLLPQVHATAPPPAFDATYAFAPFSFDTSPNADGVNRQSRAPVFAASPDGRLLAISIGSSGILLWNTAESRAQGVLTSKQVAEAIVKKVEFSGDGQHLAALYDGDTVLLWDVGMMPPKQPFAFSNLNARDMKFSADGRELGVAGNPTSIFNTDTGARIAVLTTQSPAQAIAFSTEGDVATADEDQSVRLWSSRDWSEKRIKPTIPLFAGTDMAFSPNGRFLAGTGWPRAGVESNSQGDIDVWDLASDTSKLRVSSGGTYPGNLAFSQDDALLAVRTIPKMYLWNLQINADLLKSGAVPPADFVTVRFSSTAKSPGVTHYEVSRWPITLVEPLSAVGETSGEKDVADQPSRQTAAASTIRQPRAPIKKPLPQRRLPDLPEPSTNAPSPVIQRSTTGDSNPAGGGSSQAAQPTIQGVPTTQGAATTQVAPTAQTTQAAPPAQSTPGETEKPASASVRPAAPTNLSVTPDSPEAGAKPTARPNPPSAISVNGVTAITAPQPNTVSSELRQCCFTELETGVRPSIYTKNGDLVGDFQMQPSKSPDSIIVTVRGVSSLPTTQFAARGVEQVSGNYDSGTINIDLAGSTQEQSQAKQVGVLLFTVTAIPGERGARRQVSLQVKLLAQSGAAAK
jgi:hypothetical protein